MNKELLLIRESKEDRWCESPNARDFDSETKTRFLNFSITTIWIKKNKWNGNKKIIFFRNLKNDLNFCCLS